MVHSQGASLYGNSDVVKLDLDGEEKSATFWRGGKIERAMREREVDADCRDECCWIRRGWNVSGWLASRFLPKDRWITGVDWLLGL